MEQPVIEPVPRTQSLAALQRDEEGFLLDAQDWQPTLIEPLAAEAGLTLTEERIEITDFIRGYCEERLSVPEARVVLRLMAARWEKDRATPRYLYRLCSLAATDNRRTS